MLGEQAIHLPGVNGLHPRLAVADASDLCLSPRLAGSLHWAGRVSRWRISRYLSGSPLVVAVRMSRAGVGILTRWV
jgi:hypothetical protein